jgi:hypothetical protein
MLRHIVVGVLAIVATTCTLDPVHSEAVADLGGEMPGVPPGPLHRPGQPCLVCHDGSTARPAMSIGGTIYAVLGGDAPLSAASIELTAEDGSTFSAVTNAAGNFYVEEPAWRPVYPVRVAVTYGGLTSTMSTIIGRDGSCASCHVDPPSRISAGRVYLAPSAALLPDAGAP